MKEMRIRGSWTRKLAESYIRKLVLEKTGISVDLDIGNIAVDVSDKVNISIAASASLKKDDFAKLLGVDVTEDEQECSDPGGVQGGN